MGALPAVVRDRGSQENFDALNARNPSRNFGMVTALPGTPAVGDTCSFKAAAGIYWHLLYTKESAEYPWNKIGGPPLTIEVVVAESTTSKTYTGLATAGPSLTLPLKGDYDVEIATQVFGSGGNALMSYKVGAASALEADGIQQSNAGSAVVIGTRRKRKTGLAASVVLLAQYANEAGSSTSFNFRRMTVDPVRVG